MTDKAGVFRGSIFEDVTCIPQGKDPLSLSVASLTSTGSLSKISTNSEILDTPTGKAGANDNRGRGLNPLDNTIGNPARLTALSTVLTKSRCDMYRVNPVLVIRILQVQ